MDVLRYFVFIIFFINFRQELVVVEKRAEPSCVVLRGHHSWHWRLPGVHRLPNDALGAFRRVRREELCTGRLRCVLTSGRPIDPAFCSSEVTADAETLVTLGEIDGALLLALAGVVLCALLVILDVPKPSGRRPVFLLHIIRTLRVRAQVTLLMQNQLEVERADARLKVLVRIW